MTKATNTSVNRAKQNYRELVAIQARMPADRQWTMADSIRAAKAAAYVEIEALRLGM